MFQGLLLSAFIASRGKRDPPLTQNIMTTCLMFSPPFCCQNRPNGDLFLHHMLGLRGHSHREYCFHEKLYVVCAGAWVAHVRITSTWVLRTHRILTKASNCICRLFQVRVSCVHQVNGLHSSSHSCDVKENGI